MDINITCLTHDIFLKLWKLDYVSKLLGKGEPRLLVTTGWSVVVVTGTEGKNFKVLGEKWKYDFWVYQQQTPQRKDFKLWKHNLEKRI